MKSMRWFKAAILLTCFLSLISCSSSDVKIGVILPDEGSLQEYGYQIRSGIQMAHEDLKQKEGLQKNYELIYEKEDETNPQGVRDSFMRLKEKGVNAIIGPASSAATLELVDLANENRIVLLSPASSSPDINAGNSDYVYRNYPSDTMEAQAISNSIFQKMRLQKVVMVRAKNRFAEGITYEMLRFARQNSRHIPDSVVKFDPDPTKVDWVAIADEIETYEAHGIFLAAYTDELIPLLRELNSRESMKKVFKVTCSAFVLPNAIEQLGKEGVEGLMYTAYPWDPNDATNPLVQEFSKRFQEQYHTAPGIFAATGYDALNIIVETMESVNQQIRDEVTDHMNKTTFKGLLGETDFNKSGNVTRIPQLFVVQDGQRVEVTNEMLNEWKTEILTDTFYDLSGELDE